MSATGDHVLVLAEFGRQVLEELKECILEGIFETETETIADIAVECGLMEHVPFDPELHGGCICAEEPEEGDMIYWWGSKEDTL